MFDFLHPQQAASNFGWWNAPKPPRPTPFFNGNWDATGFLNGMPTTRAMPPWLGGNTFAPYPWAATRFTGRPFTPPTAPPTPKLYDPNGGGGIVQPPLPKYTPTQYVGTRFDQPY